MVTSSLNPDLIQGNDRSLGTGHDNEALGYGDSSDTGSDLSGLHAANVDTDSNGTGERASVDPDNGRLNGDIDDADIEATDADDADDDLSDNDDMDPDIPLDTDENDSALSLDDDERIRAAKLDIDEIEND